MCCVRVWSSLSVYSFSLWLLMHWKHMVSLNFCIIIGICRILQTLRFTILYVYFINIKQQKIYNAFLGGNQSKVMHNLPHICDFITSTRLSSRLQWFVLYKIWTSALLFVFNKLILITTFFIISWNLWSFNNHVWLFFRDIPIFKITWIWMVHKLYSLEQSQKLFFNRLEIRGIGPYCGPWDTSKFFCSLISTTQAKKNKNKF